MSEIKYYSEEGLQKLKDELHHLIAFDRPAAAAAIAEGTRPPRSPYLQTAGPGCQCPSSRRVENRHLKGAAALQNHHPQYQKQRQAGLYHRSRKRSQLERRQDFGHLPLCPGFLGQARRRASQCGGPCGYHAVRDTHY